jgi:hypothetical protein
MKPYNNYKLTSCPDVDDCITEARKHSAGGKNYIRNINNKARIRRTFKRSDRAKARFEFRNEIESSYV